MGIRAEFYTKVTGDAPDVGTLGDLEGAFPHNRRLLACRSGLALLDAKKLSGPDGHAPALELDLLPLASHGVSTFPTDRDSGVGRRHLVLLAHKVKKSFARKSLVVQAGGHRPFSDDGTFGVVSIGLGAKGDLCRIGFLVEGEKTEELRRLADAHDEHARGCGIERPRMTHALLAHGTAHAAHDIMAREAEGLVHGDERVHRARTAPQRSSFAS